MPLVTQNWDGPITFHAGQVKIIIDYIRREIYWAFLGEEANILVWSTALVITCACESNFNLFSDSNQLGQAVQVIRES